MANLKSLTLNNMNVTESLTSPQTVTVTNLLGGQLRNIWCNY